MALNTVLNNIDYYQSQGFVSREVLSRATTLFVATPVEIATTAQSALSIPVKLAGSIAKLAVRTVSVISSKEVLADAQKKLPNFSDFLKSIAKTIAYAIGTIFTATIGLISPSLNFRLHCALGLVDNKREIQAREALLATEAKRIADAEAAKVAAIKQTLAQVDALKKKLQEIAAKKQAEEIAAKAAAAKLLAEQNAAVESKKAAEAAAKQKLADSAAKIAAVLEVASRNIVNVPNDSKAEVISEVPKISLKERTVNIIKSTGTLTKKVVNVVVAPFAAIVNRIKDSFAKKETVVVIG